MKKLLTLLMLCSVGFGWAAANNHCVLNGKDYQTDTLLRKQIGPGIINTIVRVPEYPLNIYILEMDLTDPNNRIETTIGYSQLGKTELLTNAMVRNRTATKRPVAACNADFWVTSASTLWAKFQLLSPAAGCARNDTTYTNTNTSYDQWNGGPLNLGGAAYTSDGRTVMGRFMWYGYLTSPKIANGAMQQFYNVNRRCIAGEMALWNAAYTRTREFEDNWVDPENKGTNNADNYYLMFTEGSSWAINKDMKFVVAKIVKDSDRRTLETYDACITATGGTKTTMSALEEGDVITVNTSWLKRINGVDVNIGQIEQYVEGNATVMENTVLTNSNADQDYNSSTYSRTGYGTNTDGTKCYMIVIDRSTSPVYGYSRGCPTRVMCQALRSLCPDVTDIVNMDAGGSAEMCVGDKIINTSMEGTPRGVCCGWMMEAVGEEDNEIAFVRFEDYRVKMPVYSSYTPKVLGYNRIGELINEDVKGFTMTCSEGIGTTEGDTFFASGEITEGLISINYNGMCDTVRVNTFAAQPAIKVKPLVVVDDRPYPIDVLANVGINTFAYDPSKLNWEVENNDVMTIKDGVLQAKHNGQSDIFCSVGEYRDTTSVAVEISDEPYIYQNWDEEWTIKGSGPKNFVWADDHTLNFDYAVSRAPSLTFTKEITFYSLPDSVALTFVSPLPLDNIQIDVRNYNFPAQNYMTYTVDGGFEAGKEYTIYIDLESLGGAQKVSTYPITLREIKFTPNKTNSKKGSYSMTINPIRAHYNLNHYEKGDVDGNGAIDTSDLNILLNIILGNESADNYAHRAHVMGNDSVDVSDVNEVIKIILGL